MTDPIVLARSGDIQSCLLPAMANRHGLVTGATGTGKTVTLQVLAESFSAMGTPVFLADIKGDLTGLVQAGEGSPKMLERLASIKVPAPQWQGFPVTLWDVFGEAGHPVRATVSDMGAVLLSRMLALNDTQAGVLALVFKVAQDEGQLLLDLKDLRAMLADVAGRAASFQTRYGNVSAASVGAIQRALLALESQGAAAFFGEPMLDVADLMLCDSDGRGRISILAADKLVAAPKLYAVFLLWLLSDLYEKLPEVGDLDKPKLVFFFDEAHLLFTGAPPALLEKIEQIVRLIRSKAVGVWFVTQNPLDIPDTVLGQLGNRVQHALRAYTPRDEQAVKVAARTMRPNPGLDIQAAMIELGVGEALVSLLDEKGRPSPTQRGWISPPRSRIGPADESHRAAILSGSPFGAKYDKAVDRDSAHEVLARRAAGQADASGGQTAPREGERSPSSGAPPAAPAPRGWMDSVSEAIFGSVGPRGGRRDGLLQTAVKSSMRTGARALVRGVLASLKKGRK